VTPENEDVTRRDFMTGATAAGVVAMAPERFDQTGLNLLSEMIQEDLRVARENLQRTRDGNGN
jgi:hypothetical protein